VGHSFFFFFSIETQKKSRRTPRGATRYPSRSLWPKKKRQQQQQQQRVSLKGVSFFLFF